MLFVYSLLFETPSWKQLLSAPRKNIVEWQLFEIKCYNLPNEMERDFSAMCGIVQDRWNEINALRNYTLLNNFSRQSHDLCFLFVHKLQFQNLSSRPAFLVGGRMRLYTSLFSPCFPFMCFWLAILLNLLTWFFCLKLIEMLGKRAINLFHRRLCSSAAAIKPKVQETPQSSNDRHPLTDKFDRFHSYLRISLTERCNLRCKLSRLY